MVKRYERWLYCAGSNPVLTANQIKTNMKTLETIAYTIGSILILFILEGVMTLGHAFDFENYSLFGWIIQTMLITLAIVLGNIERLSEEKS